MVRGYLLQSITPLQGRGDTITLAHPEGPFMQMHRRIRQKLNPSVNSENGSKMRRFTTHSHTSNLQGRSRLNAFTASQTATSPRHYGDTGQGCGVPTRNNVVPDVAVVAAGRVLGPVRSRDRTPGGQRDFRHGRAVPRSIL